MSDRALRMKRLRELRDLKASGKTRLGSYQVDDDEAIYDEVDDDMYKTSVRKRLLEDDFVVDDNGLGYAENGRYEWEPTEQASDSGDEVEDRRRKKKTKQDRETERKQAKTLDKFLSKNAPARGPSTVNTTREEDRDFLDNIFEELETTAAVQAKAPKPTKAKGLFADVGLAPKNTNVAAARRAPPPVANMPSSPSKYQENEYYAFKPAVKTEPAEVQLPSSPTLAAKRVRVPTLNPSDFEDDDDDLEMEIVGAASGVLAEPAVNMSAARPEIKREPSAQLKSDPGYSSLDEARPRIVPPVLMSSPSASMSLRKISGAEVAGPDGSIRMFWTDFCEVNGNIVLFGKAKLRGTSNYVSCMVQVQGVCRKLFFLPRKTRVRNGNDTGETVSTADVAREVSALFREHKVNWKSKTVERRYAFELPDVPATSEYLMVLYPYRDRQLPQNTTGETFSRVFGTDTPLFEQLVLLRRIMGPCWLDIKNANLTSAANSSWCKVELSVASPDCITPVSDGEAVPPMTVMSIALRTMMNTQRNQQEIVAISARVFHNVAHDTTDPPESLPHEMFTIVRPIGKIFPVAFETEARATGSISVEQTEDALLNNFVSKVHKYDPDVYVGHQLETIDMSIILHRLKDRNTQNWHRIGRLRRSEWPRNFGRSAGNFFSERYLLAGRLLCDLANDLGKSVMPKCQSWTLTEMCQLVIERRRLEPENINPSSSSESRPDRNARDFLEFLQHTELDTFFIMTLMLKTQLLPLSKQLTNLAGNSWARTLSGTRAERNEFILLHEFTKNKYIVPDKYQTAKHTHKFAEDDDDEAAEAGAGKKRDKYRGGLVFEPEKGLYDKYILVMDFNSLYPSIIQEYNICFTTVDRTACTEIDDAVPDPPGSEQAQGILPRLLATLVNRRREVKKMMKDSSATSLQRAQWDIKQQALKLTANSMYGCLGFSMSRFYARPLAMLITFKGREILTNTKELAESMQLKVVYGDTDSVMINTNVEVYADAVAIGNEFKQAVNDRYRLLEIDIDNVFQRLLMHAKKKYAALNVVAEHDGKVVTQTEVKGLDMRRREYCQLSKEASTYVLDQILSGESQTETVIERIHEYLRELAAQVRANEVPVRKFVVYNKLGKAPEQYQGGKTMPQVQVALKRKERGEKIAVNDVIAYVIAAGDGANVAERACTPQEMAANPEMHPDHEWYLVKQILPPIERLCGPIDGTDVMHLAECLGLDTRKYQLAGAAPGGPQYDDAGLSTLDSTVPDSERFRDSRRLWLACAACAARFPFEGLALSTAAVTAAGFACTACQRPIPAFGVVCAVERQLRDEIARYYQAWLRCDDNSCGVRTRQMSMYGKRCLGKDGLARSCRGVMAYEYSDKQIYNQLLYFDSLFDSDKAKTAARGNLQAVALAEHNRHLFETVRGVIGKYLGECGRRYVDFSTIFDFMQ
ncbi:putative DNA polymerase alpha catalytic subunit [Dipodascopsis tothii]|uniref:putative DNA polymerase alpha catalytic subunit n=1 Tax=Dipodascopsis tothii TaxID=44089 RepID=UPI0034CD3F10